MSGRETSLMEALRRVRARERPKSFMEAMRRAGDCRMLCCYERIASPIVFIEGYTFASSRKRPVRGRVHQSCFEKKRKENRKRDLEGLKK